MKSKCLVWFLAISILGVTTVFSQDRVANPVVPQRKDNLSQDVILVPVESSELAPKALEAAGPFSINASFDANITQQQRAVIQHAINEWVGIIRTSGVTPGNYPITFSNGALTGDTLALTTTTFNKNNGDLISAKMVFNNTKTFYVDPNPADDVEFNSTPPAGFDLLSVARHELGHALGWADTKRVTPLISGNVFDQPRLNIGVVGGAGGRHADPSIHAGDIMAPSISTSERRSISLYPAAAMVARAFFYDITMSFVDGAYTGGEAGSADAPWNTVREGADLAPFGQLLLTPRTYDEAGPLILSRPMTIRLARGGPVIIR
ncbi:MAG TPA: hypothetical protein VJ810_13180 [Blastocatellia bacterium]|nr:hypothetical protein [Blastocatellia bacterium]